jgi:hypothetical protein
VLAEVRLRERANLFAPQAPLRARGEGARLAIRPALRNLRRNAMPRASMRLRLPHPHHQSYKETSATQKLNGTGPPLALGWSTSK